MIRFAHPAFLNLLWAIPFLALLAFYEHVWRLKAMKRWADEAMWDVAFPFRAVNRILLQRVLLISAISLVMVALAGPQVGTRLVEVKREGTDIVVALDVSQSMNAEDISPSRLVKARHEVIRLLKRLRGDRVALVPFADVAFVQAPLTLDYSAVATMLNALEPSIIPSPGTNIAAAIEQARRAFKVQSKAQKIMILITDSEDHDSDPLEQAREAAKEGIRIFTLGMATPEGAPVPITDERGVKIGYKKYQNATVVSQLNEELLKNISNATDGDYFRATRTGREFEDLYEKISGMKTEEFETRQYTDYEDRFQWLLAAAFVLLMVERLIVTGRKRKDV